MFFIIPKCVLLYLYYPSQRFGLPRKCRGGTSGFTLTDTQLWRQSVTRVMFLDRNTLTAQGPARRWKAAGFALTQPWSAVWIPDLQLGQSGRIKTLTSPLRQQPVWAPLLCRVFFFLLQYIHTGPLCQAADMVKGTTAVFIVCAAVPVAFVWQCWNATICPSNIHSSFASAAIMPGESFFFPRTGGGL